MTEYPLELGNNIEKSLFPLFKAYFPNYENFRSRFLIPLTGRPNDPNWRNDTHPELERIGVASFGLLKSLNFVFIKKDKIKVSSDPEQTFKNVYFHFGLATDSVDAILRSIALLEFELKILDIDKKLKISDELLLKKFENWVKKDYQNCYQEMISEGKPIFYYPQHNHSFLSIIVRDKSLKNKYLELIKQLKDYRNFFIHNPGVDVFMDTSTGKRFAIKKEMVKKSRNWATLRSLYDQDQSLFIDPEEMITYDLINLITSLNSIWPSLTYNLELIYQHIDFPKIFKGYKRQLTFNV
jgi:hypothetical protein